MVSWNSNKTFFYISVQLHWAFDLKQLWNLKIKLRLTSLSWPVLKPVPWAPSSVPRASSSAPRASSSVPRASSSVPCPVSGPWTKSYSSCIMSYVWYLLSYVPSHYCPVSFFTYPIPSHLPCPVYAPYSMHTALCLIPYIMSHTPSALSYVLSRETCHMAYVV